MEVSTEKSKIMTNSTNDISADINGQKSEEVNSFQYLHMRATRLCKDGTCSAEVRSG